MGFSVLHVEDVPLGGRSGQVRFVRKALGVSAFGINWFELPPNAPGNDHDESLAALAGRRFDAVVDTSGYVPRVVRDAVETLDFERYLFVSSISAYAEEATRFDEDAPLGALPEASEDVSRFYGELKAAC